MRRGPENGLAARVSALTIASLERPGDRTGRIGAQAFYLPNKLATLIRSAVAAIKTILILSIALSHA